MQDDLNFRILTLVATGIKNTATQNLIGKNTVYSLKAIETKF